jgi:hypothetical protein
VRAFFIVALSVIVGVAVVSWIIGRFASETGARLALAASLVGHIAVVAAMVYATSRSVSRGGWFIALAPLFGLIAIGAVLFGAISASALWLSLSGRVTEE